MPIKTYTCITPVLTSASLFVRATATDGVVAKATVATALLLGINRLAAADSGAVDVQLPGERTYLELGGTVTAGETLMPNTDGTGIAATSGNNQGALALENGVDGDIIEVVVIRATTF